MKIALKVSKTYDFYFSMFVLLESILHGNQRYKTQSQRHKTLRHKTSKSLKVSKHWDSLDIMQLRIESFVGLD